MLRSVIFVLFFALTESVHEKRADDALLRSHDLRLQNLEKALMQKLDSINAALAEVKTKLGTMCPSGYDAMKNGCYKLITAKAQWAAAQKRCEVDGAHLVAIESQEEMELIKSFLQNKNVGTQTSVWTGGHRNSVGNWVWDGTNQPFTYTYWDNGDPGGEKCMFLHFERFGFKWNDGSCTWGNRPFICEI